MNIINYKGTTYVFKNTLGEEPKMFIDRTWYIVKNKDKHADDYLEKLSHIWASKKYYSVEYSKDIELALSTS